MQANKKNKTRESIYLEILPQIEAVTKYEDNFIANLANTAAIIKHALDFFWVGFYIEADGELVLGPFQGPLACTRIANGRGVCGTAWQKNKTLIVPDVNKFAGHIACSSESKSEIVVPFVVNNKTIVLDIDSDILDCFTKVDQNYLEKTVAFVSK